jgi:DNA-binding response OmpR family regulator
MAQEPTAERADIQRGSGVYRMRPTRLPNELLAPNERSVLVVDGSQATRGAIAAALRDEYFTAQTADGVKEMERVCRELGRPPELALLEFRLHDGRGDRAAAWLRARWPNLPIIYLSCVRPDEDDALKASLLAPATSLLVKPTSLDAILRAITRH